ncbi:MAG: hypothetical protein ACW97X_13695 [Candidatus Hodarchaeales archaeon]
MSWIVEKISEFQVLLYSSTPEGKIYLSKHKILILTLYASSFVFTFLHFANIPQEVITDCLSLPSGEPCIIPASRFSGLAVLFYFYITLVALISVYKGGSLPNFFTRPNLPTLTTRSKVLLIIVGLLFGGTIITISFIALFFGTLVLIYTGPFLYLVWTILEPYFLLSGILAITRIIDMDYHLEGFSTRGKRVLGIFFFLGYLIPVIFTIFLVITSTGTDFSEILILGFTFSFYQPALESFNRIFSSILSLTLIFLIIWWIKDRYKGKSPIRERKKGMLPLFLGLTLLFIIVTVVPLIASTRGSLQEITSLIDIFGLFAAVGLGLWNTLGVEQITDPIKGIRRLNPLEFIPRLHPYTKALFLLVISMLAFYSSVESSTIAVLTGIPDTLKLQKLNVLAVFIGWAFVVILWRYKGQPRSSTPGLIRSTRHQLEDKISKIKSVIEGEPALDYLNGIEEE